VQGLAEPMHVTEAAIRNIILSTDPARALRNDLLTILHLLAPLLRFHAGSATGFIFRVEVMGVAFAFHIEGNTFLLTQIKSM
jgi:hypothetical protein